MKKLSWRERWQALVRGRLGVVHESESTIAIGRGWLESERDRRTYERSEVLKDAFDAWRLNPLARRIVELTTQYVVGGGISVTCKSETTQRFLGEFWDHPLNRMEVRAYELCDELTRSGNLFVLLSSDAAGMSYLRCLPAADIERIEAAPNDVEQPVRFWPKAGPGGLEGEPYPAYNEAEDGPDEEGRFRPVMLHYTVNRPVGGQWGESDLGPLLKWLSRYSAWLEDRARLNRFRNAFMYVVKSRFASESERQARQATLAAFPPGPGSILVADESESWEVLSPKLEASDASTDGQALKKMVAAGSGVPMHFLAEPESSTRTTAEAAGGPSYRRFEQRQKYFLWVLGDLLRVAVNRRALVDHHVSRRSVVEVRGADISARDNMALAMAASSILPVVKSLRQAGLIDDAELLRLVYRFSGEWVDVAEMLRRGRASGAEDGRRESGRAGRKGRAADIDLETGEDKTRG